MSEADSTSYRCECMSSQAVSSIFESASTIEMSDARPLSTGRRTQHILTRPVLRPTITWRERQRSHWLEVAI